jgi:hypothetical protein
VKNLEEAMKNASAGNYSFLNEFHIVGDVKDLTLDDENDPNAGIVEFNCCSGCNDAMVNIGTVEKTSMDKEEEEKTGKKNGVSGISSEIDWLVRSTYVDSATKSVLHNKARLIKEAADTKLFSDKKNDA